MRISRPTNFERWIGTSRWRGAVAEPDSGARDMQTPHDEDEVYLVLEGRARMQLGDEIRTVSRGSVLYVRATETHSFFEIEEDMTLLVFFAAAPTDRGD